MHAFAPLETPRLHLRPLAQADVDFVFRHFSDPAVNRYLLDQAPLASREEAQGIVDFFVQPTDDTYTRWVLVSKADGQPIGTCGFHKWDQRNRRAEIGYDLAPTAWGQGYMGEALKTMLSYGFTDMVLNRVEALVYPENTASVKLLEKLNFQREGILRDYFYHEGHFYDHWLLSLLKSQGD
ncbi:GNAT family N-acetyltransferase [Leptolyngbya sp. KIOST-1]|uniref:GNAT family N-acetyltransferase n=1 Tax=Leptolyngbya sp. KIOST-1 TaxID=1229172 RepID=UPI00055EE788|nr:GNAT family protein [Leptolyngbya sp. KIOST-1]